MPAEELVDVVDEQDNTIRSSTIRECLERGLLHRAVAVLIVRSGGKLLLQQRSRRDLWHPGMWTLSSTGHVRQGESYDAAASRELEEELGLRTSLSFVRKTLLSPIRSGALTEREWVAFYLGRTDEPCRIDTVELEGVKEVDEKLLRLMIRGGSVTPDAVVLLGGYLKTRTNRP